MRCRGPRDREHDNDTEQRETRARHESSPSAVDDSTLKLSASVLPALRIPAAPANLASQAAPRLRRGHRGEPVDFGRLDVVADERQNLRSPFVSRVIMANSAIR